MIKINIIKKLEQGGVGVMPTDTIYGLVGKALNQETVERIYHLRSRDPQKPMIILIGNVKDLKIFNINLDKKTLTILEKYWPGRVSIVLDCKDDRFSYLHRGAKTLAFRLPKNKDLQNLLRKTGPIVAPSANIEGEKQAENIDEAKEYFGDALDFYIDGGKLKSKPSTLIKIEDGKIKVLRKGEIKI